jgi:very-short-patch-repair endonuclease
MQIHNKKNLMEIRRLLRQKMTLAEKILWDKLRNRKLDGLKFKRQHSIGNFIIDFYCASEQLLIELDGEIHNNDEVQMKDRERDAVLKEMNFKILRFNNEDIHYNLEGVLNTIKKTATRE